MSEQTTTLRIATLLGVAGLLGFSIATQARIGDLSERVLFGSDYPFASTPLEWIAAWNDLGMPEGVTRQVLHDNAATLLGWD